MSFHQHLFDLGDGLGRVEAFRTGRSAVHDRVTAIKAEGVLEVIEAFALVIVTAIREPAVGLQENRRAQIPFRVPPITRAARCARIAKDAFVETVELFPLFRRLRPLVEAGGPGNPAGSPGALIFGVIRPSLD